MKRLIKWIYSLFRKTNLSNVDEILTKLDYTGWYGSPGDTIYYYDPILNKDIIIIKLTKNNIRIYLSKDKKQFFDNIKFVKLNKKERIYFYEKVEDYMLNIEEQNNQQLKNKLLYQLGITEEQFRFLVVNCKDFTQ